MQQKGMYSKNDSVDVGVDENAQTPQDYESKDDFDPYEHDENDLMVRNENEKLFEACRKGVLKEVTMLVGKGLDVNGKDCESPIHEAIRNHSKDTHPIVSLLLSKGADPNASGVYRKTPLHYAAEKGDLPLLKLLLDKGADIKLKTKFGEDVLHCCCKSGNQKMLEFLFSQNVDVDSRDCFNRNPLHYGSEVGHDELIRHYLLNSKTKEPWTTKDIEENTPENCTKLKRTRALFERISVFSFSHTNNETEYLTQLKEEVELYKDLFKHVSKHYNSLKSAK